MNTPFPSKSLDDQAKEEVRKESREAALKKLKDSHRKIANAKQVLANLEREHAALVLECSQDGQ